MDIDMNRIMDIIRERISAEEKFIKDFETGKIPSSEINNKLYAISKEFLPQYKQKLSEMEEKCS